MAQLLSLRRPLTRTMRYADTLISDIDNLRLSEKARHPIKDYDTIIHYNTASLREIAIKHAIHPDRVEFTAREL